MSPGSTNRAHLRHAATVGSAAAVVAAVVGALVVAAIVGALVVAAIVGALVVAAVVKALVVDVFAPKFAAEISAPTTTIPDGGVFNGDACRLEDPLLVTPVGTRDPPP
jgi:hypothetical protein